MDLAELSKRTRIERRKLRYVLDHKLVPQLHIEIKEGGWGSPRHFAEDVGFGIVCAAHLLNFGLRHETIRHFLVTLLEVKLAGDKPPALTYVLQRPLPAYADFDDGERVRLRVDDYNSGWIPPGKSRKPQPDSDPVTTLTLNIGWIRDQVFARNL